MSRIGCVRYINALPFVLPFQNGVIENPPPLIFEVPSQLNAWMAEKQLDIALTSTTLGFEPSMSHLDFGIVAQKKVRSVNLYSRFPLSCLNGVTIGITHESATSVALLKVLCRTHWKIEPVFERLDRRRAYDAFLLIGDEALKQKKRKDFHVIDLAEAWYEMCALPFVFATFVIRSELNPSSVLTFQQQLEKALDWSASFPQEIEQTALKHCSLSPSTIRHYYAGLHYRLGKKEKEGLELFKKLHRYV